VAELQTVTTSEVAASNNAASPDGMAEGCAPSSVNNTYREGLAAQVRWFNRHHGLDNSRALLSTAGSSTVYTLTFTTAPASFFTGFIFGCKIHTTCGAAPTINVNGLGATTIRKMTSTGYADLASGDMFTGQHVWMKYDATLARVILMTPISPAGLSFTDPMTTRGDIIIRDASNATARLAVGAAARLLRSDGTDIAWAQVVLTTDVTGILPSANMTVSTTAVAGAIQSADAAAMEAQTAGRAVTADLLARHPAVAKAWCRVTVAAGTPTLQASFNVASITDRGVGQFTVNFTTAFSTANYLGIVNASQDQGVSLRWSGLDNNVAATTTAYPIAIINSAGSFADPQEWGAVFYGDQ
jgi:hypothetical protein